ncbi:hypothetical protein [Granulicella sp. S190]|uniref:hypothetical protein n=1 Tax=Granulicella sp. S190 TaxID=1747226 RepID=UPI00131B53F6|nr:hypothetical protein [Granulicella sp. S190]
MDLLSWPIFFSYFLWVFADRSNFLNLDYLISQHLRIGVDTFYSYGLLPVFLQHVLFAVFGRGYWPMIGCTIVVAILLAVFWSMFVRSVSNRWIYLLAVVAISPLLLGGVNPNFPYSLVELSMLFSLLFLLRGRPEVALAISMIGCVSVPSLPLLLTGLLVLYLVVDWWSEGVRRPSVLLRRLAPGIATYAVLAVFLGTFFSFRSMLATALPVMGMKYYYVARNTGFNDLISFLHPPGYSFKYYAVYSFVTPVAWWVVSTLGLVVLALFAARTMIRNRKPDPRHAIVVFCAVIQVFFACFAYRNEGEHFIYDPVTAAGMLVAISVFPVPRYRKRLLILFACIGLMAQASQIRHSLSSWKETSPSSLTARLYAEPEYPSEMAHILQIAATQKVLLMSNATGVHHFYPKLMPVNSWFLVSGLMAPPDRERVLASMRSADVIVEDTVNPPWFIDRDPEAIKEVRGMCLTEVTKHFQIWWKTPPDGAVCKANPRQTPGNAVANLER